MLTEELNRMVEAAEIRTPRQNDKLRAMLHDVAAQVQWSVNGRMQFISDDDWKDIFSAELKKEQRIAAGLSGGFVLLGLSTRKLKVREFADIIMLLQVFGDENNVVWSEKAKPEMSAE